MSRPLLTAWRLAPLLWHEWRHHPFRQAVAVLAVCLGVALAWSVHVINTSALEEFASAVRSANGEPDASVRGARNGFDEALLDTLSAHPAVALASPVVELDTYVRTTDPASGTETLASPPGAAPTPESAERTPSRVMGLDVFTAAAVAPDLLARPATAAQWPAGGDLRWSARSMYSPTRRRASA
jgi:putative ABC transport system permease protein